MIGRVAGTLAARGTDHVLIDVGGVAYVVYVSDRTLAALPAVGTQAALFTDLLVREDLLQLFGFLTMEEKEWHRLLMRVQGIGAKASMAILGALGADGVTRAIALGDWNAVKAAPGVGPKIAQRVVNELKDKAPEIMSMSVIDVEPRPPALAMEDAHDLTTEPPPPNTPLGPTSQSGANTARVEALSALTNLGYGPSEAARAVAEVEGENPGEGTARLIRLALRRLAPSD
ncbi:MAG: Holliday junction branch migration protein RuvA [Pseudomonadota bacterium]